MGQSNRDFKPEENSTATQPNGKPHPLLGFPRQATVQGPGPVPTPPPLPKRPKGRWFIGILLLAVCGFIGYKVWDSFFRYQAYGTVEGRIIQVSPPWDGVVKYLHVREGETVRQGQLLMTMDNLELRQRHGRLTDELRLAQATLEQDAAKLKWTAAFNSNQSQEGLAQFYETWGKLLQGETQLEAMRIEYRRALGLKSVNAISDKELIQLRLNAEGQEQLVKQLRIAVAELKKRVEQSNRLIKKANNLSAGLAETGFDQLKPDLVRIETIQAERARLQEQLDQGQIQAPANGVVVKGQRFAGEYCKLGDPLMTILVDGSLHVVLYMPQKASKLLAVGDTVDLSFDPSPTPVTFKVVRLGDRYEYPPDNIESFYWSKEKLLPIYLQPKDGPCQWMALRVGGVAKLAYQLQAFVPGANQ
jgi:multidrug resistance efflux pump